MIFLFCWNIVLDLNMLGFNFFFCCFLGEDINEVLSTLLEDDNTDVFFISVFLGFKCDCRFFVSRSGEEDVEGDFWISFFGDDDTEFGFFLGGGRVGSRVGGAEYRGGMFVFSSFFCSIMERCVFYMCLIR